MSSSESYHRAHSVALTEVSKNRVCKKYPLKCTFAAVDSDTTSGIETSDDKFGGQLFRITGRGRAKHVRGGGGHGMARKRFH